MHEPLIKQPDAVSRRLRLTAFVVAWFIAGVHLALAEDRYREARYVGALFVAGAMGLVCATGVAAGGRKFGRLAVVLSWWTGAVIAAGMFIGFLLARTAGLPGYHPQDWPAIQLIDLVAEASYLALTAVALRGWRRDAKSGDATSASPYPVEDPSGAAKLPLR